MSGWICITWPNLNNVFVHLVSMSKLPAPRFWPIGLVSLKSIECSNRQSQLIQSVPRGLMITYLACHLKSIREVYPHAGMDQNTEHFMKSLPCWPHFIHLSSYMILQIVNVVGKQRVLWRASAAIESNYSTTVLCDKNRHLVSETWQLRTFDKQADC